MSYVTPAKIASYAGGGGGLTTYSFPIAIASQFGPSYTTGAGAPAGTPPVGSIYRNTSTDDLYLYKSTGWSAPMSVGAISPIIEWRENAFQPPASYEGSTGDYIVDVHNLTVYGPKAGGPPYWPATQLHSWSLIPLAGPPTPADGVEGDWAWYGEGSNTVWFYGPKRASGWPPWRTSVTCTVPPLTVTFFTSDGSGTDPRITPGTGATSTSSSGSPSEFGGYTRATGLILAPTQSPTGTELLLGAELATLTATGLSNTKVRVFVDSGTLGSDLTCSLAAHTKVNTLLGVTSSTDLTPVLMVQSAYSEHLGQLTALTGTLSLYTVK